MRDRFVAEVERITWAFKLAEATINLPGNEAMPEIQVFELQTKTDDISRVVLTAIDKTVRTPIVFEIVRGQAAERRIRMTAAYKEIGTGTPKLSDYFSTGWQADDMDRKPLPTAISLPDLYVALLEPLMPVAARAGEEVSEVVARLKAAGKLEREVASLERKLRNEPQLNRKVELRRNLRPKQTELEKQR